MINKILYILLLSIGIVMLGGCADDEAGNSSYPGINGDGDNGANSAYALQYESELMRSYGVGYGYAAEEKYTDYSSVRDRVLNLDRLRLYEDENNDQIITDCYMPHTEQKVFAGDDIDEMLNQLTLSVGAWAKLEAQDFKLFSAERSMHFTLSQLQTNAYSYAMIAHKSTLISRHIDPLRLMSIAKEDPTVLSYGFRSLVQRIRTCLDNEGKQNDTSTNAETLIDTLLQCYGTTFIYEAELGGKLTYTAAYEKDSLSSGMSIGVQAQSDLLGILKMSFSTEASLTWSQTSKSNSMQINVVGGNTAISSRLIQNLNCHKTDSINDETTRSLIDQWFASLSFDFNNDENSNLELIDFKLAPIYELIPDEKVRAQVAQRWNIWLQQSYDDLELTYDKEYSYFKFSKYADELSVSPFYTVKNDKGHVVMEGGCEEFKCNGHNYTMATLYPVVNYKPKSECIAICLDRDNQDIDSVYLMKWVNNSTMWLTPIGKKSELDTIFYNNGNIGLKASSTSSEYYEINYDEDVDLDPSVYVWDDYYDGLYRVGPNVILLGPEVDVDDKDASNYVCKVCNDPPNGWSYAYSTKHPFLPCHANIWTKYLKFLQEDRFDDDEQISSQANDPDKDHNFRIILLNKHYDSTEEMYVPIYETWLYWDKTVNKFVEYGPLYGNKPAYPLLIRNSNFKYK